jgi:Fe-S-cluster containining protein
MPGCAMPEDFNNGDFDTLVKVLRTGKWAIDYLDMAGLDEPTEETIDKAYYIRPRIKHRLKLYDVALKGECIFLKRNGCQLPFEERPEGCRMLEPKPEDEDCIAHGATVKQAAMAWMPFRGVIESVVAIINTDSDD